MISSAVWDESGAGGGGNKAMRSTKGGADTGSSAQEAAETVNNIAKDKIQFFIIFVVRAALLGFLHDNRVRLELNLVRVKDGFDSKWLQFG